MTVEPVIIAGKETAEHFLSIFARFLTAALKWKDFQWKLEAPEYHSQVTSGQKANGTASCKK